MRKSTGLNVTAPAQTCENDAHCPFHGSVSLRGRTFVGTVIAAKMQKNATVAWERQVMVPKYERFERRRTKLLVHNPLCINARPGDQVRIVECRKISKMKNFVIVEKLASDHAKKDTMTKAKSGASE